MFSTGYTHKQTRRNIGETNTRPDLASWGAPITVTEVTSGEAVQVWRRGTATSANLFYNSPELDTDYHGGDITVNKRMSNRWSLMGGAIVGQGDAADARRHCAAIRTSSTTSTTRRLATADRPWSYRLSGVYELPYGVSASGTWQYQAGAPEETTVVVTNQTITLPQGNQTLRVSEFGDARLPERGGARPELPQARSGSAAARSRRASTSSTRPTSPRSPPGSRSSDRPTAASAASRGRG